MVDLEKAVKVIAAIPEKTDRSEEEEEKKGDEKTGETSSPGTRPAASPLPTVLGESSDKLSKMLKNVLQAKVSPARHLLYLLIKMHTRLL